jgi:DNA-binding SARP family transcriptional activator/TolB-like protein
MEKKPFELRILGSTDLTGSSSGSGDGLVRQPKRLALLAYLALETAGGFRRRDEVIGLFWPELDQAQGRTYLRKALHVMRADLGEGVILARGDDEIRIDPAVLWCDAVALRQYERAGQYREALDLYRGELLAGLFPEGVAQEFEEWIRQERKTVRHAAARCAWECARVEEEKGDTGAAAALARRALEIEPDNEEGLRRLMTLLDKRGDRAGALRVYAEWRARLKDEYEVEPAPETRKLARKVQAARKGESHETPPTLAPLSNKSPSSSEHVSAPELDHRVANTRAQGPSRRNRPAVIASGVGAAVIAVAIVAIAAIRFASGPQTQHERSIAVFPFRTIGDSSLTASADAILEEITTALAMDSTLIVRPVNREADLFASEADLAERRLHTTYVIHGAVQRSGTRIRVTLRLVRVADGTAIWAGSDDVDEADRSGLARRLAGNAALEISRKLAHIRPDN